MKRGESSLQLLNKYRGQLMGISALWILFFHSGFPSWGLSKPVMYIKSIRYSGVDIFFLLSGIGLTYAIKNNLFQYFTIAE